MEFKALAGCSAGAIAISLMLVGSASAADLPSLKSPVIVPEVSAFAWSGPYAGVSLGGIDVSDKWTTTETGLAPNVLDNATGASFGQTSVRFGGFLGYNWQFSAMVLGLEGDVAGDFGSNKTRIGIPGTLTFVAVPSADRISSRANWDASFRGRLGFLVTPSVLLYGTGGVAFQNSDHGITCAGTGVASWCVRSENSTDTSTRVGWTAGAGVEAQLWSNWTGRVEYRYSDFGSKSTTFFPNGGILGSDALTVRTKLTTQIVSVGLAYKF